MIQYNGNKWRLDDKHVYVFSSVFGIWKSTFFHLILLINVFSSFKISMDKHPKYLRISTLFVVYFFEELYSFCCLFPWYLKNVLFYYLPFWRINIDIGLCNSFKEYSFFWRSILTVFYDMSYLCLSYICLIHLMIL